MKFASSLLSCFLFAAFTASANESPAPAKPDLEKGAATAATCSACHSSDGSRGSPAQPILQNQHPDYLVKQLTEFKKGVRANAIMSGMAATLSESDMKNVAAFYASKKAQPGAARREPEKKLTADAMLPPPVGRAMARTTESATTSGSIIPSMLATPSGLLAVMAVRTAWGQRTETLMPWSPWVIASHSARPTAACLVTA